jgi:hypothetical protein
MMQIDEIFIFVHDFHQYGNLYYLIVLSGYFILLGGTERHNVPVGLN